MFCFILGGRDPGDDRQDIGKCGRCVEKAQYDLVCTSK
jgi:hypothetical protein